MTRLVQEEGLDWKNRLALLRVVDLLQSVEALELFNLQLDLSEEWNVAEQYPDIVQRLTKTREDFSRGLRANSRPPLRRPQGNRR